MALTLNESPVTYAEFYGRNVEQMPKLIADGRTPLSVSGLMKRRLELRKLPVNNEVRSSYVDNYFDTGDVVVYHPDGRIKIALDSKELRGINPQSQLRSGALVLPDGVYNTIQGAEFKKSDLEKYTGDLLSARQARKNPLWQTLARDKNLLEEYADFVFKETKDRFSYDKNMGIYLGSAIDVPTLRAWCVRWLDYGSSAGGVGGLGDVRGRFVGVSAGGAGVSKKTA
ncbi:MAG: hypothetical protein AABW51_02290 [Nanoarchaeota archaeon]